MKHHERLPGLRISDLMATTATGMNFIFALFHLRSKLKLRAGLGKTRKGRLTKGKGRGKEKERKKKEKERKKKERKKGRKKKERKKERKKEGKKKRKKERKKERKIEKKKERKKCLISKPYRLSAQFLDDGDKFTKNIGDKGRVSVEQVRLGSTLEQRRQNMQTTLLARRRGRRVVNILSGRSSLVIRRRRMSISARRRRRPRRLHHGQRGLIQRVPQEHPQHDEVPEQRF